MDATVIFPNSICSKSSSPRINFSRDIYLVCFFFSFPFLPFKSELMALMDTFFVSHGAPTLAVDETIPVRKFFQSWQQDVLKDRPNSILVVSAHWETQIPTVNAVDRNDTIHDFYGFPKPLYQLKYNSLGAPALAKRVKELLMASSFEDVDEDKK